MKYVQKSSKKRKKGWKCYTHNKSNIFKPNLVTTISCELKYIIIDLSKLCVSSYLSTSKNTYFTCNMWPVIFCILKKVLSVSCFFLLCLFSYCRQFTFYLQMKVSSSHHSSMASMAACYGGGPGLKSQQGREFTNFWLKRKFNNSNLNTIILWVYELTGLV